ncbi:hypothetical protein TcYC6_0112110 [Trypanosoma cruzi]|nr:hypothetical protein TcYC6_0112110 [Trypanosoma cruzi]
MARRATRPTAMRRRKEMTSNRGVKRIPVARRELRADTTTMDSRAETILSSRRAVGNRDVRDMPQGAPDTPTVLNGEMFLPQRPRQRLSDID